MRCIIAVVSGAAFYGSPLPRLSYKLQSPLFVFWYSYIIS